MKSYALIRDAVVAEIIPPSTYDEDSPEGVEPAWRAGDEIPIGDRFTPDLVATMVDITSVTPIPGEGWAYNGSAFSEPVERGRTPDEILALNTATRDALLSQASTGLAPLQTALLLGIATDAEKARATAWVTFTRAVDAIDLSQSAPTWPTPPSE